MPDPEDVLSRPAPGPGRELRYAEGGTGVVDVWDVPGSTTTVALVHGGFWKAEYDRTHLRPLANALSAQGFSVASVEYPRVGMPGGGWPGTVDATFAALRAVLADARLPHPVVAVGHSAGGHLVALAGSEGGVDGLAGVVPLGPVVDLRLAHSLGLGSGAVAALLGDADREEWEVADPSLRRLRVPAVLLHGEEDDVVPVEVSEAYAASRTAADAPLSLVRLPGLGHLELVDPTSPPAFAALLDAVRALAAPAPPAGPAHAG